VVQKKPGAGEMVPLRHRAGLLAVLALLLCFSVYPAAAHTCLSASSTATKCASSTSVTIDPAVSLRGEFNDGRWALQHGAHFLALI
jgi:hypothetical protein